MQTVNRSELAKMIAEKTGQTQTVVREVLATLSTQIQEQLRQGKTVRFEGVGIIAPRVRNARTGRNPKTGESIDVPAKTGVNIKPARALKAAAGEVDPSTLA